MDEGLEFKIKLTDESPPKNQKMETYSSIDQHEADRVQDNRSTDAISISASNYDLNKASHPQACIFTCMFKILAVFSYLFLNILVSNRITVFIVVVVFTAFDFWTVKNVTGRLLVGLRWQSDYQEDGTEIWRYQSHNDNREPNRVDAAFFWSSQLGAIIFWGLFSFINILSFSYWTFLNLIVLTLSSTNFYGFYKCRGEHQKKVAGMKEELTKKGMSFIGNMMFRQKFGS